MANDISQCSLDNEIHLVLISNILGFPPNFYSRRTINDNIIIPFSAKTCTEDVAIEPVKFRPKNMTNIT